MIAPHLVRTTREPLASARRLALALVTTGLLTLLARPLAAQQAGSIAGRVTAADDGTPIAGVFIGLDGNPPAVQTDAHGRYRIDRVSPGSHIIEARRLNYARLSRTVQVRAGEGATADLVLAPAVAALKEVTVIGTRTDLDETRARVAQIPGAVSIVEPAEIRSSRQANLKDVLKFTPGVYVQPRFGAADESQISIRGSGLRNNFHLRGVNVLVNGMPYRNADGFSDFESLELLTTEAIEVYKGANALRYGGSTMGGAINLQTKTGYTADRITAFGQGGSFGFLKGQLSSGGNAGGLDYYASYARTQLDGYRAWSGERRDRVNLHAGYKLSSAVDARAFYFYAKVHEHLPGSVTAATMDTNPRAADATNLASRWGRDYDLHHLGVQLRAQLTPAQRLEVSPYLQYRDIDHPIFEVINQLSHDWGAEVRYENAAKLGTHNNRLTIGVQPAYETMRNQQYQNVRGAHGTLTRDEQDRATGLALYAEDAFALTPRLTAAVGVRLDRSTRNVKDFFLSNGDQSDEKVFRPVTPRAGLVYSVSGRSQLFANASRTVEPPLFLELSSFGNPGGFIDLAAQEAWQYELGTRGQRLGVSWEASLYDVELENEILNLNVQPFPNARFTVPTYRNAPKTRHYGLETGLGFQLPGRVLTAENGGDHVTARLAYTFARYRYVEDPAYGGKDIPGAPRHHLSVELKYAHPNGLSVAPSLEWVPQKYFVNSVNSATNGPWSNLGLRAEWAVAPLGLTIFASGQNLADRVFSQSVQVDNAAGKYYEPADRRSFYAGLRWGR